MVRRRFIISVTIFILGLGLGIILSKLLQTSEKDTSIGQITEQVASTTYSFVPDPTNIAGSTSETAWVRRVIDGDTIELTDGRKIRYIGIDTPETVDPGKKQDCFGEQASDKNQQLVAEKQVELEKDISQTDRYGRYLRYVYVNFDGNRVMVNEFLVRNGFALSSSYPPDIKYQSILISAQQEAREKNLGLWQECSLTSSDGYSSLLPQNLP